MKAVIVFRLGHQKPWCLAMRAGLRRHGIEAAITEDRYADRGDFVVCWGWRNGDRLQNLRPGRPVLVMERGYVGDRFRWTSLGWDGLNGRARFFNESATADRWQALFADRMRPWKSGGEYAVVMGQVPGDMAVRGVDMDGFYADAVRRLRTWFDGPILFRPHPQDRTGGRLPTELAAGELDTVLANAACVVTWNSNSGVDAVLAGVPTVAADRGAMAWDVTRHDADGMPPTPDRAEWAARLAHCQWSAEEIERGEFWEQLKCRVAA